MGAHTRTLSAKLSQISAVLMLELSLKVPPRLSEPAVSFPQAFSSCSAVAALRSSPSMGASSRQDGESGDPRKLLEMAV